MKIVYAYVCGDIIHIGHLRALQNAKALGDKLVVGVLTDEAVMEEKARPTIPFSERLTLVRALKCVDVAIPQNTYSPHKNVVALGVDILIESSSHSNELLEQSKNVISTIGGRMVTMPYYPEQSSTKIKKDIKSGNKT